MAITPISLEFRLEGLPEEGEYFGYEDYRLDQPDRGLFYIGVGTRSRVCLPGRFHNRGHVNISKMHGVLRKVVRVFDSVKQMNAWEISRIREVRQSGRTLVNKADGGEGTRGLMPCRNEATGETRVFRIEEIPEGWVHSSTGMVPCRNRATGETTNFNRDAIPEGWDTLSSGTVPVRNTLTNEVQRIPVEYLPDGWEGINKGRATYKDPRTGETAMFSSDSIPEGWVHVFTGMVTCRNIETGETAAFSSDAIPAGWVGVTKGMVACKNPITGETGSFPKDLVPPGWVGVNSGNKKADGVDAQVEAIARQHPNIIRRDLVSLCVESGINKKSAQHTCWKLNLGKADTADQDFQEILHLLRSFVSENDRLPTVTEEHKGIKIGSWCHRKRQAFRKGKLPESQKACLEEVPGWWWSKWSKK